jgi:hypothetical protein
MNPTAFSDKILGAFCWVLLLLSALVSNVYGQVSFPGPELLGRPTNNSVTVNVVADAPIEAYFEYGTKSGNYLYRTPSVSSSASEPIEVVLSDLQSNTLYYYRMVYRQVGASIWIPRDEHSFHTQRSPGSTFTFAITSDSHVNILLGNSSLYQTTLLNIANDSPDFHLDLGDTFAMDSVTTQTQADTAYLSQRSYMGPISHSSPIFLALGNHEQEEAWHLDDTGNQATSKPVMGANARKRYFLNPVPDAFYTGNPDTPSVLIEGDYLLEDYYAWEWGNALFVVIDPFWYTTTKPFIGNLGGGENSDAGSGDRWDWTLGWKQYSWLKQTLENSTAAFKFIFAHQETGGTDDYIRGGASAATYNEWGGYNNDGITWGFGDHRPGWDMPVHQLMVQNGVTAFFHGHDHEYAYEKRDGIIYQLVPMAADAGYGFGFKNYNETDPYTMRVLPNSGHLRVTVSPLTATVDYVRAFLPADGVNGQVADTYTITYTTNCATPNKPAPVSPSKWANVSAGGAATCRTAGGSGPAQTGYAIITRDSGTTPYGTAVFTYKQNGITIAEAGVPISPPTTSARIFIDYRSSVNALPGRGDAGIIDINTGIAVINYGAFTARVTYTLRNANGIAIATGKGTIAAGNHFAKFIDQLDEVAKDFVFPPNLQFASLDIISDLPLSVLALRMTTNQRRDPLFTTIPLADMDQPLMNTPIYFPQIADGGGWATSLILLNTSSSAENGVFEFLDNKGLPLVVHQAGGTSASSFRYSIAPGGTYHFQTDGSSEKQQVGWVRLTPDAMNPTPIGSGIFSFNPADVMITESGIASAPATTQARIYVDLTEGHNTGLAIANLGAASNVTIQAFQADGITPAGKSPGSLQLAAHGHDAKFANQLISGLPENFTGVLDIRSPTAFAAVTVRSLFNERDDFLLTAFPVADLTQPPHSPIVFPHIADGGGYMTQIVLLGANGPANTTISFHGENGNPLAIGK